MKGPDQDELDTIEKGSPDPNRNKAVDLNGTQSKL